MGFQTCRDVTFSHTFPGDFFSVDLSLAHWKPRGKVARNPTVHYTKLYFIISYSCLKTWNDDRTVAAHICHGETKRSQHHKLYSRQNKINSRQNKMYGGPQLSRHYKLYSRQNKISSWQYKVTHGNIKLTHGKTKFTRGKTKKTIWSAVVICISNGTSCNSKQTKWRPLSLRIVVGRTRNQW